MKVLDLAAVPALEALIQEMVKSGEPEVIVLRQNNRDIAVTISKAEYDALLTLEEAVTDKLDIADSEEILKNPEWVEWDHLEKQLKP
jgi:hypothetical protein